MAEFEIKQGDTLPRLEVTVVAPPGKSPAIPVGSTVVFKMREKFQPQNTVVSSAAVVDDFDLGAMGYAFTSTDTGAPGRYQGNFVINTPGGDVLTVPNGKGKDGEGEFIEIVISPKIP